MGTMLAALLRLQSIERQVAQVRGRLRTRQNAVNGQQKRIDQLKADYDALHQKALQRQKDGDALNLDLKSGDEKVAKSRAALNLAKTNKEYAAVLTQINTIKADNAKQEEGVLKIMQEVEAIKAEAEKLKGQMDGEAKRMEDIVRNNGAEIQKLNAMLAELTTQRAEAAKDVPAEPLAVFERVASNYDGEGMAMVEIQGKRPPHDYICGGCYMSLSPEHANALKVRDEIRTCNNCGRILYMEKANDGSK